MITEWIIAIATTATFIAIIFVERSRRRYERTQIHSQRIKDVVLAYLKSILSDYYLRILDRREGFLIEDDTSLEIKPPSLSLPSTLGDHIALQEHSSTYPHLYEDIKTNHLSVQISKLEQTEERFRRITIRCHEIAKIWPKKIENEVHIAPHNYARQQDAWVNYSMLSIYIYENLWGVYKGHFRIEKLVDEQYGLYPESTRWGSIQWGKGTKDEMERCQNIVNSIIAEGTELFKPILKDVEVLKEDVLSLKKEFESLILVDKPFDGKCSYV